MGTGTVISQNGVKNMHKSFKNLLSLFKKRTKKKDQQTEKDQDKVNDKVPLPQITDDVQIRLEPEKERLEDVSDKEEDDDDCFAYKERKETLDTQTSQDSGFSETNENQTKIDKSKDVGEIKEHPVSELSDKREKYDTGQLTEKLKDLHIDKNKKKKTKVVPIARGPIKNRDNRSHCLHPYNTSTAQFSDEGNQISRINKKILSGGDVIINNESNQIDQIAQQLEEEVNCLSPESLSLSQEVFQKLDEYISSQAGDFEKVVLETYNSTGQFARDPYTDAAVGLQNYAIDDFSPIDISEPFMSAAFDDYPVPPSVYNTPPKSVPNLSPMPDITQFHDTTLSSSYAEQTPPHNSISPALSTVYEPRSLNDYEEFQNISPYDDFLDGTDSADQASPSCSEERKLTLKQFKHVQDDWASTFSRKECCQKEWETCEKYFEQRWGNLKMKPEDRSGLCIRVAKVNLAASYGVLMNVLDSIYRGAKQEDLEVVIFSLLCRRMLAEKPQCFLQNFGLDLLVFAVLRCYRLPVLTKYLVECIRAAHKALRKDSPVDKPIFDEVDSRGDNLVSAFVSQVGDAGVDAFFWIVKREPDEPPLFEMDKHANADGYSALHVACMQHSASSPRFHTVHILLVHGGCDLWKKDIKGGDTPLHMAVRSVTCDVNLVLILFKYLPSQKDWKKYAHVENRSSKTPIEFARSAVKSNRPNFPPDVLSFFKKCR